MARCSACHGEFEAAKQPLCPLCGAKRPRPAIRVAEPPPPPIELERASLEAIGVREDKPKRLRRRRHRAEPAPATEPIDVPVDRAALRVVTAAPTTEIAVAESEPVEPAVAQPRVAPPAPRAAPPPPPGPPPIEVEYAFGGESDEITLVSSLAVLERPAPGLDLDGDLDQLDLATTGSKVFGKARSAFRRR